MVRSAPRISCRPPRDVPIPRNRDKILAAAPDRGRWDLASDIWASRAAPALGVGPWVGLETGEVTGHGDQRPVKDLLSTLEVGFA